MTPPTGAARVACVAWAVAACVLPSTARAQGTPNPKQACIAAAEQGQSERDDGKYRAARTSFLECARETCPRVISQSCTRWLRELEDGAPTVVLAAKDAQGNDLNDVTVLFDGQPFATHLDGKPIEADAGEHVFRFERDGSVPVEQKVLVRAGEKARVIAAVLQPVEPPEPEPGRPAAPGGVRLPELPPLEATEPALSGRHVVVAALAVGAAAAAGAGAFFVLRSNADKNDAADMKNALGGSSTACTNVSSSACSALADRVSAEHREASIATGLFVGAGALAAAAVVTWFAWPRARADAPAPTAAVVLTRTGAAFGVAGAF